MPATLIPADDVQRLFKDLYGLPVAAAVCEDSSIEIFGALANYVDSTDTVKGRILCDMSAAAILGAALVQIPPGAVEDAVAEKKLPGTLRENVSEVFNIIVNIFPAHLTERLVLKDVQTDAADVDTSNASVFTLTFPRYGEGKLFVFAD